MPVALQMVRLNLFHKDAKEKGQLHLFSMLTKACGCVIKNMALLMKEEVAATDAALAALVSIEDAPATCLRAVLMRKFLSSEPALITAVTTSLVGQCSIFSWDATSWD